ncbi:S41 family peptidase [Patescibacteria group bacterium]
MTKKQKILNVLTVFLIMIISLSLGYYIGSTKEVVFNSNVSSVNGTSTKKVIVKDRTSPFSLNENIDFSLFWDVWDLLKKDYVNKPINEEELLYGALEGMVASLKDPYSVFFRPVISKEFTDELSGEFQGIGAEIGMKNDRLTVISPLPNTPAEKSGLKAGDEIFAIDGEDTYGMYTDEAVSKIRGEKGTEVVLLISRKGRDELFDINIIRDAIKFDSVRWEFKEDGTAYIRILHFNTDTKSKFAEAVKDIMKENPSGIILDLRGNPGGYLDAAVEVASSWIEEGPVVVEYYSDDKQSDHNAVGRARLKDFKTVVLINGGSASGSEIVAGALQDYNKATLIGTTTFGKGSVQSLSEFDGGSSVKLTVAKWLTPNGNCISEKGIIPDMEIEFTAENVNNDIDPQMDEAIKILLGE